MELWTGMKTQGSFEMGCGKGKSRGEGGGGECGISVGDGPCTPWEKGESVAEAEGTRKWSLSGREWRGSWEKV